MGIWIAIAIGVFIVGSIMGLKPSARETMRDVRDVMGLNYS